MSNMKKDATRFSC